MDNIQDLTVLVAHPDDEVLFLWPFLLASVGPLAKQVCAMVSDHNNLLRQMAERRAALRDVCHLLGVGVTCHDLNSDFYALSYSPRRSIQGLLPAGPVATHNPWGEYGHLDHMLLHQMARGRHGQEVYCTDICSEDPGAWFDVPEYVPGEYLGDAELDLDLFNRCRDIYRRYGCWTWSWEPQQTCGVYRCV